MCSTEEAMEVYEYFNRIQSYNEGFDKALEVVEMFMKGKDINKEKFDKFSEFSKKIYKLKPTFTNRR